MSPPEPPAPATPPAPPAIPTRPWPARILRWLLSRFWDLCRILLVAWGTLAIYYSNLPWAGPRLILAGAFCAFAIWALWVSRWRRRFAAFAIAYLAVLVWWTTIRPSHERPWRQEVAVMPQATVDGDRVRISGFRNFEYRSRDDFTPHYEEREFLLSQLTSVDFYVSYWKEGPVGHTFLSFNFENALPLCISIETRPEEGEGFDPLASLFKQFELIYVVGDERDLVRLRTDHRDEDVYLYRLRIPPEKARQLLLVYLERINDLADRAEFYHLLSNSCTINIVRYANRAGRTGRLDFRHVLNGLIDRYLYHAGFLDSALPFEELRQRSWINDDAKAAGNAPDFSERIRSALPPRRS